MELIFKHQNSSAVISHLLVFMTRTFDQVVLLL